MDEEPAKRVRVAPKSPRREREHNKSTLVEKKKESSFPVVQAARFLAGLEGSSSESVLLS